VWKGIRLETGLLYFGKFTNPFRATGSRASPRRIAAIVASTSRWTNSASTWASKTAPGERT